MISDRDALFYVTTAGPGEDVCAVERSEYEGWEAFWAVCTGRALMSWSVTSGHEEDVTCEACIEAREGL